MKLVSILVAISIVLAFTAAAMAVPAGRTIEYPDGAMGKVIFDGKVHAEKGLKCGDCHPVIFQMKKDSTPKTMADINAGKACGACHNGTKAFKASDAANCGKCHKK
jgi:c(7)-type cytochrome triheme protein